jgi:hypothetical protein
MRIRTLGKDSGFKAFRDQIIHMIRPSQMELLEKNPQTSGMSVLYLSYQEQILAHLKKMRGATLGEIIEWGEPHPVPDSIHEDEARFALDYPDRAFIHVTSIYDAHPESFLTVKSGAEQQQELALAVVISFLYDLIRQKSYGLRLRKRFPELMELQKHSADE